MDVKNEVLTRVYILLFGIIVPIALILMYKTVVIGVVEGPKWRSYGERSYVKTRPIKAERGNILAHDGSLLATSVPFFDLYFDPTVATDDAYFDNLDTLSYCFAHELDKNFTVGGAREYLIDLRDTLKNKNKHVSLKRKVSFAEKNAIEQFPLFNLGQYRGGLIAKKLSERKRPFGVLARRTIGYVRDQAKDVGLEDSFNEVLGGKPGEQVMMLVDKKHDLWIPMENLAAIEPQQGADVVTTIDVNIQDITERALYDAMKYHDAEWGTAVVMEVKTGKIRAIANLGRVEDKKEWYEVYNYAVGRAIEPGSTFKLASIMALLEDDFVTLEDKVDIEHGKITYYDQEMVDAGSHSAHLDTITVRKAFEISSNVGLSKLVTNFYGKKEGEDNRDKERNFIRRLKQFGLNLPTDIEIKGEAAPLIKEVEDIKAGWSGLTLPWMATGYEVKLTPLQLLTFYNAVANNGILMKPMLVERTEQFGLPIEEFRPTVVKREIASRKTIEQAHQLLEGVVERGTAYKLKTNRYKFAGKTGTTQIGYKRFKNRTRVKGYQASFAGYFPSEKPIYSCIVVIYKPEKNGIYGGDVAGPVFRKIADKCYDSLIELHAPMNRGPKPILKSTQLPRNVVGNKKDIALLLNEMDMPYYDLANTEMVRTLASSDSLVLEQRTIGDDHVPNVVGMGLRDALYILENRGFKVRIEGAGKVVRQSIKPGTKAKGQTILLTLK